jgi:hypothetical protein
MRGPRFTLRQVAIAIAVISAVLAFWVRSPIPLESLVGDSIPVALGFMIASLVRHEVERMSGCSMRSPRIVLILIGAGIGSASLAATILIGNSLSRDAQNLQLIMGYSIPTLLGFVIYQVSQGSLRFRLTIEIVTIVVLLALSGWTWRPQNVLRAAEHADALAAQVSAWAEGSNAPKNRDRLRRESKWFRRRAFSLRCQAYWYGLTLGPSGFDYDYPYDTAHLVHELGILKVMDAHEMRARQEHEGRDVRDAP